MPVSIQHQRSANRTLRIVCPNGHLGFAPIKTGSFEIGAGSEPDLICADFVDPATSVRGRSAPTPRRALWHGKLTIWNTCCLLHAASACR